MATQEGTPLDEPLNERHCQACSGGIPKLSPEEAQGLMRAIPEWTMNEGPGGVWQVRRAPGGSRRGTPAAGG